jgi:hypothetical protein
VINKIVGIFEVSFFSFSEDSFFEESIQFLSLSKENPSLHESQLGRDSENGPFEHVEHLV